MIQALELVVIMILVSYFLPETPPKCPEPSQPSAQTQPFSPDYSPFLAPSEPNIFADDQQSPTYITKDCETFANRRICYQMQWKI